MADKAIQFIFNVTSLKTSRQNWLDRIAATVNIKNKAVMGVIDDRITALRSHDGDEGAFVIRLNLDPDMGRVLDFHWLLNHRAKVGKPLLNFDADILRLNLLYHTKRG